MTDQVVVIGAGHAGVHCAATLVERGWTGGVVLVDESTEVPYERPPLSKAVLKTGSDPKFPPLRRDGYFTDNQIELIQGKPVHAIDRSAHVVRFEDEPALPYGKLIIATGARPRPLPVLGGDSPHVTVVKTAEDARRVRDALQRGLRLIVIGAGYIGLEVAAAAAEAGCRVTVLETAHRVMSRVTSEAVSAHFEQLHRTHGVSVELGAQVVEIRERGSAVDVVCADGSIVAGDLVVVGIGVVPNDEIAALSGLSCADGVLVDAFARTDDPDVYAIGDVTRFLDVEQGVSLRLECVQNALDQAEAAADHLLARTPASTGVTWFWTIQYGTRLQTAGVRGAGDQAVLRGDPATGKFSVLYVRDGRLAAIDTIKSLKDFTAGKQLIAAKSILDLDRAVDPLVPLAQCTTGASVDDDLTHPPKETVS